MRENVLQFTKLIEIIVIILNVNYVLFNVHILLCR